MDTCREMQQTIAEHYGMHNQSRQAVEEMAELTQALTKFWRYKGMEQWTYNELRSNIVEELADVQNMIEQLCILFRCEEDMEAEKKRKINRQLRRMQQEIKDEHAGEMKK